MRKRTVLPAIFIIMLVMAFTIMPAYATESFTFIYTAFNTPSETIHVLKESYTMFTVKIEPSLIFNETTSDAKAIVKIQNVTEIGQTVWGFDITFFPTGVFDVNYVVDGSSDRIVYGCKLSEGSAVYIIYDGSYFTIRDYKNASNVFLEKFAVPDYTLRSVKASGEANSVTAGYMTVTVDVGYGSLDVNLDLILQVVPIIATIAVLGVIVKTIKYIGER